jgi:protein TonB
MTGAGYFEQKQAHPTGFAAVVALHAAALAAMVLIKGPVFVHPVHPPTEAIFIPPDPTPPPEPQRPAQRTPHREPIYVPPAPPVDPIDHSRLTTTATGPTGPIEPIDAGPSGPPEPPARPIQPPVRMAAQVDPRYRDALQPIYPASEQRLEREGSVRVRVVIDARGRVVSIEKLSATSDAFWEATRRQALAHWRFRPATEDGRPIQGTMVMTVTFRLADI